MAAELRRVAAAGFVLARNEDGLLPLETDALEHVAVLGPNAAVARTLGGGSATVFPPYTVSPLDGLRAALGDGVQVDHAVGVLASARTPVAGPPWIRRPDGAEGVEVRFLAADGSVLGTEQRPGCAFNWMGGFGGGAASRARRGPHRAPRDRPRHLRASGVSGVGRYRLEAGGEVLFDDELRLPEGADIVEALMIPPQGVHELELAAGEEVEVVLTHEVGSMDVGARLRRRDLPAQPAAAARHRRRGDRAGRRAGRRRGRRGGRRRHDRGGRERGLRPHVARAARPPGRARPARRGGQPAARW